MAPTEPNVSSTPPKHPVHVHVPHLSYRNSLPSDYLFAGSRHSTSTTGTALTTNTAATTSTIITSASDMEGGPRSPGLPVLTPSSSHTSASRSPSARSFGISARAQPAKTKKKTSFLGTLFTKEPSTDAFLQMQHQSRKEMDQNPGRMNPPGMSGVSSVKIPENVPRVNSKWDGMPRRANEDYVRRDSRIDFRGSSIRTSSTRSRSVGPSGRESHSRHLSDSTNSSNHPNQARRRSNARQDEKRAGIGEVNSVAESVSSSNSVKHPRSKSISIRSQSLRSPSGSSLPHITSFFPNDIPEPPGMPQGSGVQPLTQGSVQASSKRHSKKGVPRFGENCAGTLPDHASSPGSTPLEQSPITPLSEPISLQHLGHPVIKVDDSLSFPLPDFKPTRLVLRPSGSDVLNSPVTARKVSKESVRGFLAGEARLFQVPDEEARSLTPKSILKEGTGGQVFAPSIQIQQDLEKRPDSSRARLGLRASIIRDPNAAPWEWNEKFDSRSEPSNRAASPRNLLPKSLGIFGKA